MLSHVIAQLIALLIELDRADRLRPSRDQSVQAHRIVSDPRKQGQKFLPERLGNIVGVGPITKTLPLSRKSNSKASPHAAILELALLCDAFDADGVVIVTNALHLKPAPRKADAGR